MNPPRRQFPLPPTVHQFLNTNIYDEDIIEVEITLSHENFMSEPDILMARVMDIHWSGDEASVTVKLIHNHFQLEELGVDLSIEDLIIEVYAFIDDAFIEEVSLPDSFAEGLLYTREKQKKEKKRRTANRQVYEDACIDPQIAAIVCHTGDGIKTRNKFYPLKL